MYIGGTDFVLKLDMNDYHVIENFTLKTTGQQQCQEFSSVNNQSHEIVESYEGTGISPFVHTQNSLSLTVEPTFISASWVKRKEDPENDKIYIFFREKNSDPSPEADPWISRVAQVCKVDEGGSKRFLQNMWTSFLKSRLVCGFPEESLYFNHLQDIYVMHADDWRETRVYALFTSGWNSTAVCIYTIGMIEGIFENSTFKGYDKDIPTPRPGTKKLVVGFSEKISTMDLQRCVEYNNSCEECVLARDPYCAWTKFGCTPTVLGGIQNLMNGEPSVCATLAEEQQKRNRTKRETNASSPVNLMAVHTVPLDVPFYLSCPIDSYHAVYTWKHEGNSSPCMQMQSNCLHLIPAMAQENYGIYNCVSREKDYEKVVKKYELKQQITQKTKKSGTESIIPRNGALKVASNAVSIILGLATAGLTNCYSNLPALSF
ncbi:hypothetical protein INR49_010819 [Caranx melampygus]|nr:hypothetical protein INR49_010819 [Caranx melampygus]